MCKAGGSWASTAKGIGGSLAREHLKVIGTEEAYGSPNDGRVNIWMGGTKGYIVLVKNA